MKILVTGATGLAGAEVIRQAMVNPEVEDITAIVRRPLDISHLPTEGAAKLKVIVHKDFMNYDGLEQLFKQYDACIWCLGISQTQVSKDEYHVITYDYTIAAANAMMKANPSIAFVFLSGAGADSTEMSKTLFARVKGKAENALQRLHFKKLVIARPGGIRPIHANKNAPLSTKVFIPLFPILERVAPKLVISSVELAKALIYVANHDTQKVILENTDLKDVVAKIAVK